MFEKMGLIEKKLDMVIGGFTLLNSNNQNIQSGYLKSNQG
jgi:hypothetical protein